MCCDKRSLGSSFNLEMTFCQPPGFVGATKEEKKNQYNYDDYMILFPSTKIIIIIIP